MDYRVLDGRVDVRTVLRYIAVLRRERPAQGRLCCATCGLPVTSESDAIRVEGSHTHFCRNIEGQTFYVGCFGHVEACVPDGDALLEWTWFVGHRWQAVRCQRCNTQLGWVFTDHARFWALTLNKLANCENVDPCGAG